MTRGRTNRLATESLWFDIGRYLQAIAMIAAFCIAAAVLMWAVLGSGPVTIVAFTIIFAAMAFQVPAAGWRRGLKHGIASTLVYMAAGVGVYFVLTLLGTALARNLGNGGYLLKLLG